MKIRATFTHTTHYKKDGYTIYSEANRFYLSLYGEPLYNADNYNDCYRTMLQDKQSEHFTQATNGNY